MAQLARLVVENGLFIIALVAFCGLSGCCAGIVSTLACDVDGFASLGSQDDANQEPKQEALRLGMMGEGFGILVSQIEDKRRSGRSRGKLAYPNGQGKR